MADNSQPVPKKERITIYLPRELAATFRREADATQRDLSGMATAIFLQHFERKEATNEAR